MNDMDKKTELRIHLISDVSDHTINKIPRDAQNWTTLRASGRTNMCWLGIIMSPEKKQN